MICRRLKFRFVVCLAFCCAPFTGARAIEPGDELVQMVVELIGDQDKDVRALGFDQVRIDAPGEGATRQFAAQLPKLSPEGQAGLLSALADRGDPAARSAVLEMLKSSPDEGVKMAAITAIGALADPADVHLLVELVATGAPAEQAAARASLVKFTGDDAAGLILAELKQAPAPLRVALIEILASRRALDALPDLLPAAIDDDVAVRAAAMAALGQLAGPAQIPGMVQGVLKAPAGPQRQAAERSLLAVCNRIENEQQRAEPLLAAMNDLNEADRLAMLPMLGRVGGAAALQTIEAAIGGADPKTHEVGLRALCNWPNAAIAPRLIELVNSDDHPAHRALALRTLIRVAPLADGRTDGEKLELLQQVTSMCTRDDQRQLVLQRAAAIRTLEALRFVVPFMDQPAFAQQACESAVELAHHRGLREPNKAEFDLVLDRVVQISKDPTIVDRATRYKNGQTWNRPRPPVGK